MRHGLLSACWCCLVVAAAAAGRAPPLPATPACPPAPAACTAEVQSLLDDASVGHVLFTAAASPFVVDPLRLSRSHVLLEWEDGAQLLARRWGFNGTGDSLLSVQGAANVTLLGAGGRRGSSLRMWRADYSNPEWYEHGEWRMALRLEGVRNATVRRLRLEESGGDGIYLTGGGASAPASENVVLQDVNCTNNYVSEWM